MELEALTMVPHSGRVIILWIFLLCGFPPLFPAVIAADGPLILTPLIEAGAIDEARTLARVGPLPGDEGVVSYAGYFTVNETYNSNLYFWFFPAEVNYETAPVILWLEGGPGGSSLATLFLQNGPFAVESNLTLSRREYSWATNHSVLYIDNPVGTGFSFTDDVNGYSTNQNEIATNLYSALIQFYTLFPELQANEFFPTGESYAGKYVPAIAYVIHTNNPTANLKINLKGLGIAAGFSDPENMLNYGELLYQIGLIDGNGRQQFQEIENLCVQHIQQGNWLEGFDVFMSLVANATDGGSLFTNLTGFHLYQNYLHNENYFPRYYYPFLTQENVRQAIHVGNTTYGGNVEVPNKLKEDFLKSVKPWLEELLENYRVLLYNGQLDIIVAPPLTSNYVSKLQWSGTAEYQNATRYQWHVGNDLAGYVKTAGNLIEVMVRNAGHGISHDQPAWGLDLINKFVANIPIAK